MCASQGRVSQQIGRSGKAYGVDRMSEQPDPCFSDVIKATFDAVRTILGDEGYDALFFGASPDGARHYQADPYAHIENAIKEPH